MCGRFVSTSTPADLAKLLDASDRTDGQLAEPDYNVAPTKPVPGVVERHGERELLALRWGLVPSWAKDPRIGSRLINARAETVADKPAFRAAFAKRRCLIPADGYYEWEASATPKGPKQPYLLTPADGSLIAMAGLYEIWREAEGKLWWTCTIITTDAPDELGHIHDRTPMTVPPDRWAAWLDPDTTGPLELLTPALSGTLTARKVSTAVNNARNNGPELLKPIDDMP
jgi:putative SOS response-associated peptidase YedK